jgi:hypothetical protein
MRAIADDFDYRTLESRLDQRAYFNRFHGRQSLRNNPGRAVYR